MPAECGTKHQYRHIRGNVCLQNVEQSTSTDISEVMLACRVWNKALVQTYPRYCLPAECGTKHQYRHIGGNACLQNVEQSISTDNPLISVFQFFRTFSTPSISIYPSHTVPNLRTPTYCFVSLYLVFCTIRTKFLTVVLDNFQVDAQTSYLFTYNTFIKILYMFRALTLLIIRRSTS